ncbi:hypothetical protein KCU85_g7374, partial [Aureobasidium melanogenum]
MHSALRILVAALALMTITCFYYQISDLPHLNAILRQTPQANTHASTTITSGDDSSSRSAPGFHIPQKDDTAGDSHTPKTDLSTAKDEASELPNDKVVVMGALSTDDVAWATTKLHRWDAFVYTVDNNTAMPFHTDGNKGREANAYLTYIIQNYNSLHTTVAFVHSHEFGWLRAWHTDAPRHSNVESLNSLNIDFVQRNGYTNLRCLPDPGCPDEVRPFREPKDEGKTTEAVFAAAWRGIFANDDVPEVVGVACCAQFAVSKQQILQRTKEEYVRMHAWLMNTQLDDQVVGRVFEYLWHIIFGQESVYCPSLAQCYRDVYGTR